uniref:Putative replication factor and/or DNA binding/packaging n=1 Tax=Rhinella marina erythrocytic-like virus TaxID=2859906 RepID=A0A8F6UAZ6_9VIRU|nr:putative replication factor and/or DNA binding/packaging [Rhinella marina erythrocytic-like virus]
MQLLLKINTELLSLFDKHNLLLDRHIYIAQTTKIIQDIISAINNRKIDSTTALLKTEYLKIVREIIKMNRWDIDLSTAASVLEQDICECQLDDSAEFCDKCAAFQYFGKNKLTTRDFSRVNIVSKFVYSRITHFKDCMKQYQGRQNASIPDMVLNSLEKKFLAYKLLDETKVGPERYKKITKAHIITFLRELRYSKHYENTNLIYFKLRGEYFDSIKHLETKLLERFKQLVEVYDELKPHTNRKNFMNIQYILFQLLRSLNHPCSLEDFTFLKTTDRKRYHDDVCRKIFKQLEWKFTNL